MGRELEFAAEGGEERGNVAEDVRGREVARLRGGV